MMTRTLMAAPVRRVAARKGPGRGHAYGRMNGLGQFEFVDPGYGFELAASDIGMSVSDFAFDPLAFDLGLDMSFSDFGFDTFDYNPADFSSDFSFGDMSATDWGFDADWGADFGSVGDTGFEFTMPEVNMNDVLNLVKTGFSVYQAYEQLTAEPTQQTATAPRTTTTATTQTRLPYGSTGYVDPRTGTQMLVDPRTGQLVAVPTTQPAAGGELIPGVPNWALLAGAAGIGAIFLMGGKRR